MLIGYIDSTSSGQQAQTIVGILIAVIVVATTWWIWRDAHGRDWSGSGGFNTPGGWVVASLLLWIVAFPTYLICRRSAPRIRDIELPTVSAVAAPILAPSEHRTCPDCAETVLAAARVCKHCGQRFDGDGATSELSGAAA